MTPLDPEAAHAAFCVAAKMEWALSQDALRAVMIEQRSLELMAALDILVVKEVDDPPTVQRLAGPLRIALNALGRLYGIPVVRAEARVA